MKHRFGMAAAAGALLCVATTASAQDAPPSYEDPTGSSFTAYELTENESYWRKPARAPIGAFELTLSGGYTQGFGNVGNGVVITDVAGPGAAVNLGIGVRVLPHLSVGLTGQYQELMHATENKIESNTSAAARSVAPGIEATLHMAPYSRINPFLSLGTGYRFLWDVRPEQNLNVLRHGFELAKLSLGLDWRVSRSVGIGPVIGADVSYFMWGDDARGQGGTAEMRERGLTTFVYGALQGRFDIGGRRVDPWTTLTARR